MSWYEESFGEDYLLVYRHRDNKHADQEVQEVAQWLDLSKGETVLDLCCGTGRHSRSLARMGCQVTGIDLSEVLLSHAKSSPEELGIHYVRGDMRELPFADQSFDTVVNLFTSFGYFMEDKENAKVMTEIKRVLKPKGRFLIDFLNRNTVINNLVPRSERMDEGIHILEERWIEGDFVRKKITLTKKNGEEKIYQERVKMYTREQMEEMMGKAGLQIETVSGDFKGSSYNEIDSQRMIFTGRVPA
ncbi:class I SAM-dependent methyltransferase [Marininema halotolerans]|uniref:Ubiquinone/menaquinone biosynthesis C-methylase UbiE n=1 Tax=Marininema halotolerans TaxID=1155944 RepID=A0A1I6RLW6_9BACL|nr:class I SAM-dependent methyltransferase [Marininema halotolerans]SFS65682.1 Ubiquinone/menaquinone biosynthesis C-methylase UbiE [Marininema halotolerans]